MESAEITVTIDGLDAIEEVQGYIDSLKRKASKYHRLYQQASGKAIRYARTIESLRESKLFYKRKIWAVLDVLPSEANWHNAPDHIICLKAQCNVDAKEASRYRKLYEELKAQSKNSMSIGAVYQIVQDFAESGYANYSYFSDEEKQADVSKFIEEWRKNNDC